jgi:hypothetical protein
MPITILTSVWNCAAYALSNGTVVIVDRPRQQIIHDIK